MQKVLLTGGSGYLGSHIAKCLLSHNLHVTLTTTNKYKAEQLLPFLPHSSNVQIVECNFNSDSACFARLLQDSGASYCIHTASPFFDQVKSTEADHQQLIKNYIQSSKLLALQALN